MATVRDVMSEVVFLLPASATIAAAVTELKKRNVGMLVIVEAGAVAGMLTERDIVRSLEESGSWHTTPIAKLMHRSPPMVEPETRLSEAIQMMAEAHVRYCPVIGRGRIPIGVLSMSDLVRFLGNSLFSREILGAL